MKVKYDYRRADIDLIALQAEFDSGYTLAPENAISLEQVESHYLGKDCSDASYLEAKAYPEAAYAKCLSDIKMYKGLFDKLFPAGKQVDYLVVGAGGARLEKWLRKYDILNFSSKITLRDACPPRRRDLKSLAKEFKEMSLELDYKKAVLPSLGSFD